MNNLDKTKQAIDFGFTESHTAEADDITLYLLIRPDTDLDSRYRAFDTETGEYIRVNGWMFTDDHIEE